MIWFSPWGYATASPRQISEDFYNIQVEDEFSYSEMMNDRWEELTGEKPDRPLRVSLKVLDQLRETYDDEDMLKDYLFDSVSAWIWANGGSKPYYVNTSVVTESNAVRVGAYRAKGGSGKFSLGIKIGGEIVLNETEWLFYLSLGEIPDFEIFRPCPAWLAVSQVYGRKTDDPKVLMGRRWAMGDVPFEKAYKDSLARLKDEHRAKTFLLNLAPSFREAVFSTLQQSGIVARGMTEEGYEETFKSPEAKKLCQMKNLAKRDRAFMELMGVDDSVLDEEIHTAEEEWVSTEEEGKKESKRTIELLTEIVDDSTYERFEEE